MKFLVFAAPRIEESVKCAHDNVGNPEAIKGKLHSPLIQKGVDATRVPIPFFAETSYIYRMLYKETALPFAYLCLRSATGATK